MACNIAVYKFFKLSHDEVAAMLGLRLEETKVYQEASAEGEERGIARGRQEGFQREQALILRQLNRRIGTIDPHFETQIFELSVPQLETLGEALLDFSSSTDLEQWLRSQS
jgi:predicted transposase YdaD